MSPTSVSKLSQGRGVNNKIINQYSFDPERETWSDNSEVNYTLTTGFTCSLSFQSPNTILLPTIEVPGEQ